MASDFFRNEHRIAAMFLKVEDFLGKPSLAKLNNAAVTSLTSRVSRSSFVKRVFF